MPIEVFLSYSHKDDKLRQELIKHLNILKRQRIIEDWHDRKLLPGSEWKQQIDEHINTADIILLLVSADFLNWDAIYFCDGKGHKRDFIRRNHFLFYISFCFNEQGGLTPLTFRAHFIKHLLNSFFQ